MSNNEKDIPGFDGAYKVNKQGVVFSFKRYPNGIVKKQLINQDGYMTVNLNRDNKIRLYSVHRIVARAFIANPENKETVNHIDGNKLKNNVENLEWATRSENTLHSYRVLKNVSSMKGKFGAKHHAAIPIKVGDIEFECMRDAAAFLKTTTFKLRGYLKKGAFKGMSLKLMTE